MKTSKITYILSEDNSLYKYVVHGEVEERVLPILRYYGNNKLVVYYETDKGEEHGMQVARKAMMELLQLAVEEKDKDMLKLRQRMKALATKYMENYVEVEEKHHIN